MSNDSKPQEIHIAEEFVETTRNRLERSYKNNVIVTIVVLSLVTLYFVLLNRLFVDDALDVAGTFTDLYKGKVEKYTALSKDSLKVANVLTDPDKAPGVVLRALTEQTDSTIRSEKVTWESWVADLKANLKEIPKWAEDEDTYKLGNSMEKRVENWTLQVLQDSTTELGETVDIYLENNKSAVAKFAENSDDEDAFNILADGLQSELVRFMDETEITNKGTLADQSRNVLTKLQHANEILKELAGKDSKDLDREQRQLRLAIALMMEGTDNFQIPEDGSK
ncbi:MAG: hypothetical protein H8E27_09655 [Verrucomicrobia subdivision 3 bacterium]|nr:hypothetical protein [Limisphaerales bacterium]